MADYNPNKFTDRAKELYHQALKEAKEILKHNESGSFIAIDDFGRVESRDSCGFGLEIWAIGVNEKDHIVIKAFEITPYNYDIQEWHDLEWIDIEDGNNDHKIEDYSYPNLYKFVVDNLEIATSQEEADEVDYDEE